MKILVCDDQPERSKELVEAVTKAGVGRPDALAGDKFTATLKTLFKTVKTCLDPSGGKARVSASDFDGAVVVLDNNLSHLEVDGTRMTAESIAGYIRAFTSARYIVSVNKNPDLDFDLGFLVGDNSTRADLALNTPHLKNAALWNDTSRTSQKGFLPWYWPGLTDAAERRGRQISLVKKALAKPLLKTLGFDSESTTCLTRAALGALSPELQIDSAKRGRRTVQELTFRDIFLASDRSIPVKAERKAVSDGQKKGNSDFADVIGRCVAADLDLWFRQHVVAPQEPLVDLPHLLVRFPFLLGKNVSRVEAWNAAVRAPKAPYGLDRKLYAEHLAEARFAGEAWVPHPCFWWTKLKRNETLNERFAKASPADWPDVVFCEDSSLFVERRSGSEPTTGEFLTELDGSWTRRHIARIHNIKYAPRSRLAQ